MTYSRIVDLQTQLSQEREQRDKLLSTNVDLEWQLAATERQRDELLAFIQGLEWIPHPDYRASKNALYCPSCQRGIKAGHASDCTLAAIARARSGSGRATRRGYDE